VSDILSKLGKPVGATEQKTRVGRGVGSGLGKTAGRGQKGQYARVRGFKRHFEGGQTPIQRRLPKRGFRNAFSAVVVEVNVRDLERFEDGSTIDEMALIHRGLVKGRYDRIKILGDGELTKRVNVSAHAFSSSAVEKIQKVGGKVLLLNGKRS
jgi:large subunit ribosomal protein L15